MAGPVGIINEEAASSSVTGSRKRIWRCTMGAQGGLLTQWTNGVIAVRVDQMSGRRKRGPCNTSLPQLGSILQGLFPSLVFPLRRPLLRHHHRPHHHRQHERRREG